METMEILNRYNLSAENAAMVAEFMKETDAGEYMFVPVAINTILTMSRKHRQALGEEPTLENIKQLYDELPASCKEEYGDNYLLGYINILMCGQLI